MKSINHWNIHFFNSIKILLILCESSMIVNERMLLLWFVFFKLLKWKLFIIYFLWIWIWKMIYFLYYYFHINSINTIIFITKIFKYINIIFIINICFNSCLIISNKEYKLIFYLEIKQLFNNPKSIFVDLYFIIINVTEIFNSDYINIIYLNWIFEKNNNEFK